MAMSIAELQEEIAFQRIVLSSIDSSVPNQDAAIAEVKAEISGLEQQLRTLRDAQKKLKASAHDARPTGISSTGTPLLSPTYKLASRPSNKRSYDSSSGYKDNNSPNDNKSRRTSPFTGPERSQYTPTTSDEEIELMLTQRKQRDAVAKLEQEKADSEYARMLQAEIFDGGSAYASSSRDVPHLPAANSPSASSRSAFDKLLGRPQPSSRIKSEHASTTYHGGAEDERGVKKDLGVKSEVGSAQFPQWDMPGSFPSPSESDSDIEVIPADQFSPNAARNLSAASARFGSSQQLSRPETSPAEAARLAAFRRLHARDMMHPGQGNTNSYGQNVPSYQPQGIPYGAGMLSNLNGMSLGSGINPNGIHRPGYMINGVPPAYHTNPGLNVYGPMSSNIQNVPEFGGSSFQAPGSVLGASMASILSRTAGFDYNTMTDIDGNPLDQRIMNINNHAHVDPRRAEKELQDLLKNISNDADVPKDQREGTPEGLKYPLYEHQKLALTWMKQMEEGSNKGGILADDMGLGKTISTLALIISRPSEDPSRKTTLIVGPVALIRQWEREIRQKTKPSHRLSTFIFHGNHKASWDNLKVYDVVLTTYGTLGHEFKRYETWSAKKIANPNMDTSDEKTRFPFLGSASKWFRVCLDEAQCIKNKNTKAAQAASYLKALTRFCLTGTPMMNGVHELHSLIHFLRIKPYNDSTRFNQDFRVLTKSNNASDYSRNRAMRQLQAVLKAIMLRRTKTSEIDGKPILILPEKTEVIDHVLFNEDEQAFYTSLEAKSKLQFNRYQKAGTVGKNYSNILVLLLRLRQACCHPHLIMDFEEAPPDTSPEAMAEMAKTLEPDVIRRIIEAAGQFECPVCYDVTPNPRLVIPCGHDTCSECLVKITSQQQEQAIQEGNDNAGGGSAKCPSCRGKIEEGKIIDYETFKKVHMPEIVEGNHDADEEEDISSEADDSDTESGEDSDDDDDSVASDDGKDLKGFVVPDALASEEGSSESEGDDDDLDNVPSRHRSRIVKDEIKSEVKNEHIADDIASIPEKAKSRLRAKGKGKATVKDEEGSDFDDEPKEPKTRARPKTKGKGKGKAKATSEDEEDDDDDLPALEDIGFDNEERNIDDYLVKKNKRKRTSKPKKSKKKVKPAHQGLALLKKEASKSAANKKLYMSYLKENWVSSAKTDKCMNLLRATEPGVKTIIFSQFTTLLDLLEIPVSQEFGRCYRRYDGSMSADARNDAVVAFTDKPKVTVMLVSLKAGNAGLNLVAASQVIILDPFWNPYIEMQAVDRAHRIGQLKPVKVHRILIKSTVEDRIMALQEQKRKLVEAALDENASRGVARLGAAELAYLFNANGVERETANRSGPSLSGLIANRMESLGNLIGVAGRAGQSAYPYDSSSPGESSDSM